MSKSFARGVAHVFDVAAEDGPNEDKAIADDVSHGCFSRLKASQEPRCGAAAEFDAVAVISEAKSKLQKHSM